MNAVNEVRSDKAIAFVELSGIARGMVVADASLKGGNVTLYQACPICPGKFMLVFGGAIGAVKSAMAAAVEKGGDMIVEAALLSNIHDDVLPAISSSTVIEKKAAFGIVEAMSGAAIVQAADAAAKASRAKLIEIRFGRGLGAKAYFSITGEVADVKNAITAAEAKAGGLLIETAVITKPHDELPYFL